MKEENQELGIRSEVWKSHEALVLEVEWQFDTKFNVEEPYVCRFRGNVVAGRTKQHALEKLEALL